MSLFGKSSKPAPEPVAGPASSPTEAIDQLISLSFAPVLKSAGYSKHGRTWEKPAGEFVYVVNVQASSGNMSGYKTEFYINYGVYMPAIYKLAMSAEPPKHPKEYDCFIRDRLQPAKGSVWSITGDTDIAELSNEITLALQETALPSLDAITTPLQYAQELEKPEYSRLQYAGIVYAYAGDTESARRCFLQVLKQTPPDADLLIATVNRAAKHYGINLI